MPLNTLLLTIATCFLFAACGGTTRVNATGDFTIEDSIQASQANGYVGERKVICGKITRAYYARSVNGSPTFLNMDNPADENVFTIVIWGKDRNNFSDFPEVMYDNQNLCVRGLILSFQGTAEVQVKNPAEVRIIQ